MKDHADCIIDLGDARVETRGASDDGPLDVQTFQRYPNGGIQADD
ncbi:hypothetical protein [Sphingopyxis indica]|nr:hypothetical protein [Sphingopyxis indica]